MSSTFYTAEQEAIIKHDLSQHALVSAIAGSGKTQTLIARIEYLINKGVKKSDVLVLMFNKSTAIDFAERLAKINLDILVDVKTFHAMGLKIVRYLEKNSLLPHAQLIEKQSILDQLTREALQKTDKLMNIKEPITPEIINRYQQFLSVLKSSLNMSEMLKKINVCEQYKAKVFFSFYERLRVYRQWRTLDDLIYEPISTLIANEGLSMRFGNRYRYVVVDEYQDINDVQQVLLKLISASAESVMAVGDVNQTIYEWRGSRPFYMFKGFTQDFKHVKRYHLSLTFRYGHLLSIMSNEVIQHNKRCLKTLCFSAPQVKKKTNVQIFSKRELRGLIQEISRSLCGKFQLQDVVVLVRKYSSSVLVELACLEEQLDYHISGGRSVFKLPVTQSIFGYLYLVSKAKFLLMLPDQVRKEKIIQMLLFPSLYLTAHQLDIFSGLLAQNPLKPAEAFLILKKQYDLPLYQVIRLKERIEVWDSMLDVNASTHANNVIKELYKLLDLKDYLANKASVTKTYMDIDVTEAWLEFSLGQKQTIMEFLDYFEALKVKAFLSKKKDKNGLLITSIHNSKGLQWQHVILCDMTEQSFFSGCKDKVPTIDKIENERRLFYVGITRAISKLSIVGGNDLAKLNKWFAECITGSPQDLRKTNSVRFLYESHLKKCKSMLQAYVDKDQIQLVRHSKHSMPMRNYLEKLEVVF